MNVIFTSRSNTRNGCQNVSEKQTESQYSSKYERTVILSSLLQQYLHRIAIRPFSAQHIIEMKHL